MHPKWQGMVGESQVLAKFIELGVPVSAPFGDNCSYDLIAEFNGKLNKIQVKSSVQTREGKTIFEIIKKRNNHTQTFSKSYKEDEVDYYALYSIERKQIYLFPYGENASRIVIRHEYPKNNQIDRCNMEEDYLIDKVLEPFLE